MNAQESTSRIRGETGEDRPFRFVVGVDLGTTNSAVAYVDLLNESGARGKIHIFDVPQLTAPGEIHQRPVLPSFLYLPGSHELPPGSTALPWKPEREVAVGEFAREQGAAVPGRLVSSAKSWLAHGGVDRTAPILPWGKGETDAKVSPVDASARYLQHIRESWNDAMARQNREWALEEQLVVLTVPASFDEVARELTVQAAHAAGIPRLVLLEEPLAAFYSWLSRHESDWHDLMTDGQLVWVCDVGGGTTDFTVVAVREGEKGLRFDRLAVGDHLMLGGDNMDHALGRYLENRMLGAPGKLDSRRWHQLCHQARGAKEELLGDEGVDSRVDISVVGMGARLIAGTLKGSLSRDEVRELVLEGFFPVVRADEAPETSRRTGLTEWGLPYVQDAAVTRHMAGFWRSYTGLLRDETGRDHPFPDFLLFNGGALVPASVRERLVQVVGGWFLEIAGADWSPRELENPYPHLAVAVGAAYYGLVRAGEGVRVGAGSPRTYYVEVGEREGDARTAVCLVPRGTEEGFESELREPAFEVLANQPVSFHLFSSATRLGDRQGEIVELPEDEITLFPPIKTVLRYGKKGRAGKLPVRLAVRLTEVGTLELWCRSLQTPHEWRLRFDVRQEMEPSAADIGGETLDEDLIQQAREKIRRTFDKDARTPADSPERLVKGLEGVLGIPRGKWSTTLIRGLADCLLEVREGRRSTVGHEARWLNLLGFCLRPGFGDPLDDWRVKELWKVYLQGLAFPKKPAGRLELWILLRRVAGGLSAGRQWNVYQEISSFLLPSTTKKGKSKLDLPKKMGEQEEVELWMAAAAFERLPVETKVNLGRVLVRRIQKKAKPQDLWSLSRLGARAPFHGPVDRVVPPDEAAGWLKLLLELKQPREKTAQAAVQMARLTGDRARDLSEEDRQALSEWLDGIPGHEHLREVLLSGKAALDRTDQDWVFGESLPSGLVVAQGENQPGD